MNEVVIRAERLSKKYRIGERQRYKAIRDILTDAIYAPMKWLYSFADSPGQKKDKQESTIWALKDVSFEIKEGEVVGVIGRNGAGKSTLLRILSRITEPTEGYVDIRGRVGSLLEVGTGFHPELTGRENIYLNGSIIGMTKREIDSKFDEIVTFAEVSQFLDTSVKYYSIGMYMRLAFSVAAHLEPEILIVDEVLAVGDAAFQKKCLGKMEDVAHQGRTVLFVSHNLPAVRSLCNKCIVFDRGKIIQSGKPTECIDRYLSGIIGTEQAPSVQFSKPSTKFLWMSSATIICNSFPSTTFYIGDCIALSVDFVSEMSLCHPRLRLVINTHDGIPVLSADNRYQPSPKYETPVLSGTIRCDLGMVPLAAGRYMVSLHLGDQSEDTHVVENTLSFEVIERDIWGHGQVPPINVSYLWWPTTFHFLTTQCTDQLIAASVPKQSC